MDTNKPKPSDGLPDGIPTFEDLWQQAGFKDPSAKDPAIHNEVMQAAGIASAEGESYGGSGIYAGPNSKVKDIDFAQAFPGEKQPEETEIILRDIRDLVRDLKTSVDNFSTYLQSLGTR